MEVPYTFNHFMQELDQVQQDLDAKGAGAPLSKDILDKIQAILTKAHDSQQSFVAGSGNLELRTKLYHLKDCLLAAAPATQNLPSTEVKRIIAEVASLANTAYLTDEVLSHIGSFLTLDELKNLPTVSEQFTGVARADYLLMQIKTLNAGTPIAEVCGESYQAIEEFLTKQGHLITNFNLINTKFSADELLHLIGLCPNLQELILLDSTTPKSVFSNQLLKKLANLETLKSVTNLELHAVSTQGSKEPYNAEGLAHLLSSSKLPHLEALTLRQMDLRALGTTPRLMQKMEKLPVLKNLKKLSLHACKLQLSPTTIGHWPLPKLNSLDFSWNQLNPAQLLQLAPLLTQVDTLELCSGLAKNSLDTLVDILQTADAKNLTTLALEQLEETPEAWQRFFTSSALQNVQQLHVAGSKLADNDIAYLATSKFTRYLRHCDLGSNRITHQGVKTLLDSPLASQPLSLNLRGQNHSTPPTTDMIEILTTSPVIQKITRREYSKSTHLMTYTELDWSQKQREKGLWHVTI